MSSCIFCKIINHEIPSKIAYEDDDMIIIKDINPQANIHYLMIPKEHYANIMEMTEQQAKTLAKCIKKLSDIADDLGLKGGFRLVSNKGKDACQSVEHLHIHILGGEQLSNQMA
jgi:histidine triad (HIT) family protein